MMCSLKSSLRTCQDHLRSVLESPFEPLEANGCLILRLYLWNFWERGKQHGENLNFCYFLICFMRFHPLICLLSIYFYSSWNTQNNNSYQIYFIVVVNCSKIFDAFFLLQPPTSPSILTPFYNCGIVIFYNCIIVL